MYPEDLKYSAEHEWVRQGADGTVRIGVTHFAQDSLGDIVYVALPEVGDTIEANSAVGELESVKSVNDVYTPVSGEVVAINGAVDETPGLVNSEPYDGGWLFEVKLSDPAQLEALMDADSYQETLDG
ncbi:glycine cleavage system protein GcvH [Nocardioides sp. AE5]|uniref:glycine cleavage system protein GcvH n=1 Tax=Nocardioides sp. AE5 TaxID=2962573 RepID=UPI002880E3C8|nr:glycine cleavage system protein GcvH [Nocardioides sp. AE5]MDT0201588.1 glycine cleavage system protein GcvH [Nocardioides sp. AE5]